MSCPLCGKNDRVQIAGLGQRVYWRCSECWLIAVDSQHIIPDDEARTRYAAHNNTPECEGYVQFLSQILDPMRERLKKGERVLDFGCGPGPVLAGMIRETGAQCDHYDPLFFPDAPHPPFDHIFSTECFEHFAKPGQEIAKLIGWLRPGGCLAVMTLMWETPDAFASWFYLNDPTHVCFYHLQTFTWIAERFDLELRWTDEKRCLILWKRSTQAP